MKKYSSMTDEQLISELRSGNAEIMDYLMDKYKPVVRKKARAMYLFGGETEDLIQEGMIGLIKAVRDYDPGRDASFYTFADLCVSRQMYTAVQASSRKKHMPLNRSVSLNAEGMDKDGEGEIRLAVPDARERSPEDMVIDRENLEQLESVIEKELSPLEKQVLDLYLTGMGYAQIARVLGRDGKSTDNALQRIRGKLRKAFRKEE